MSTKPLPWFRLYGEMIDDEKVRLLAFEDRWHYVALLCCKCAGLLDAGDKPELLRRKLGVKLGLAQRELEAAATRLAEVGLIDAETFQPLGWDGRQFTSDTDPTAAERKRRQRERQRGSYGTDVSRVTPVTVTRTDTDKDTEEEQKQEQRAPRKRAALVEAALPEWLDPQAWQQFVEFRKRKAPLTARAAELAIAELAKLRDQGHDPVAVINQSILNGWRGLFALKENNHAAHRNGHRGHRESEAERVERINRELDERERGDRPPGF